MASLARSTILRPTLLATASRRMLSNPSTRLISPTSSSSVSIKPFSLPRIHVLPRVAAFHTTVRRDILPPGPQVVEGGVNEPAPVPKPSPTHGSYHWTFERLIALGLIPLTITPFASGSMNPTLDAIFCATVLVHSHIGFSSCVTDYFPKKEYPGLRNFMRWLLNVATVVVAIGFYEFETNDVGLTEAIKRIWHAGKNDATVEAADINRLGHDGKLKHLKS